MPEGTILVIDDNADNRALAQATLEDEGCRVVLATSGAEGIARFAEERPDCVLLDIRMPGMDGIAACRELRALPGGADVPILFLTALRDVDTFDSAQAAGGDDYITKPVRPSELVTRVRAAIKLRRLAEERNEAFVLARQHRDELMRLQLQKEQLTAFLVHDLKNPVNAIELHAQRILRDPAASERARDAASKIQDESRALLRMLMNLLDLGKADEGRLEIKREPVAVPALFEAAIATMRARALAAQVTLAVDVAPELALACDAELVRRALENLIDNAIRYSPEGSTVRIAAAVRDHGVELRVVDAGPGVPEPDRERVFERYASGSAGRANRGLGLAFCKLAVELHGGAISIEDAQPGASFRIWIPDGG